MTTVNPRPTRPASRTEDHTSELLEALTAMEQMGSMGAIGPLGPINPMDSIFQEFLESTDSQPTEESVGEPTPGQLAYDALIETLDGINEPKSASRNGTVGPAGAVAFARNLGRNIPLNKNTAPDMTKNLVNWTALAAGRAMKATAGQIRVAAGVSDVEPHPKDRRFQDEAFTANPIYRRVAQSYLDLHRQIDETIDELELDESTRLRVDFLAGLVTETMAPTNHLLGNPRALRKAAETKGVSLANGLRNAVDDAVNNGGMPLMVDSEPFIPGETKAATPGAVVFRNEILELIQYEPTTDQVREVPVLISPPQINKFYVLDLAPGRSLVEHAVSHGYQTLMVSWRNPGPAQADWDLNDYVRALLEATDATMEITGVDKLNMLGVCAGGMTNAVAQAHLAAIGDQRVNSASFLVSVLDWDEPSTLGSLLSGPTAEALKRRSETSGMLSGEDLGKVFAFMRPNDLVWNYWANNYLMGEKPAAYDVLAWNCDSTNLPAGLHHDFMDMAAGNTLTKSGAVEVLGTELDLKQVTCPSYVVGAVTDHITPWKGCYRSVDLLGGDTEFVLSSQGHIQALVNPSGNPKGSYHLNPATPESADEWLDGATKHPGSWWDHWVEWLTPHSGEFVDRPVSLGNDSFPPIMAAPGQYLVEERPTA